MSQSKGGKGGSAKGKKPGAGGATEEKGEDVLQAVVLADSFQDRFEPFTLEKPRCLLPLANTPLIDYTLEYLAMNGVQEVFIYCGNHTDQVEAYINESPRWSNVGHLSPFSLLEFVRVNDASSPGDFLRDLDKRGLISGDFILVNGDLVANIPLDGPLTEHRKRREANRDAIMTMVLREAGSAEHRTKSNGLTPLFVVEAKTGRCLHYEEIHPLQADHHVLLDPAVLEHGEVDIRGDLIDCQIDICTPDVLALWSDSFDYESPRKNFLHGVLKDWELNGKLIHTEIVGTGYAARASNLQLYEAVTRDVIARWSFPIVPDSNLVHGHSYSLRGDFVYAEKGVKMEANAKASNAVIGMKTTVGTGSTITNSVVGRRCQIGDNVRIENSFIWDDTAIEDGARISRSVLAESVTVGKNSSVAEGSLISFGVQISDDISLPPNTTLSLLTYERLPAKTDSILLGTSGKGAVYTGDEDDQCADDPSSLQKTLIYSIAHLNLSSSSISTFNSEFSEDSDGSDAHAPGSAGQDLTPGGTATARSRLSSFASDGSGSAAGGGGGGGASNLAFHADAVTSLVDALRSEDTTDLDAAKLEFMGLRLANDASDAAVRRAVATALVRHASDLMLFLPDDASTSPLEPSKAAERTLTAKKGTAKFVSEVGLAGGDKEDQALFVLALQRAVVVATSGKQQQHQHQQLEVGKGGTLLAALLQHLYNLDVLEEEGILAWWEGKAAVEGGERMAAVRERCRVLIDWLQEEEEEEDDDDDDDDDEDDDSGEEEE